MEGKLGGLDPVTGKPREVEIDESLFCHDKMYFEEPAIQEAL